MLWRLCGLGTFLPTALVFLSLRSFAAERQPTPAEAAATLVQEALHREVLGLPRQRAALLEEAAALAPEAEAVRWAQGYVRLEDEWIKADEAAETAASQGSFEEYYQRRAALGRNDLTALLRLAQWCGEQGLLEQQRAHLTQVLELNPDHLEARRALGFVRVGNRWLSRQEILAQQAELRQLSTDLQQWRDELRGIRAGLASSSSLRRRHVIKKLMALDEAEAIRPIELLLGYDRAEFALPAIEALAARTESAATEALARIALFGSTAEVRAAAATRLRARPREAFVPQMLASLSSPYQSRTELYRLADGRLVHQQVIAREGQDQRQEVVLAAAYRQVARESTQDRSGITARTRQRMALSAAAREQQLAQQNLQIQQTNQRTMEALRVATGEEVAAAPEAWWQWWNEENELFVQGEKPTERQMVALNIDLREPLPPRDFQPRGPSMRRSDCLAAGTVVWTLRGKVAVEQVLVGDLVLSQDVDSGQLSYKPVLRTTIRPAGPLVRVEIGHGQQLETSGGHLFWVSGQGWVKARELESGSQIHTACGVEAVSLVSSGESAVTYNLVVADFNTYFAGESKLLCHDNTLRKPTNATVPGLATP